MSNQCVASLTAALSCLRMEHGISLWKGPVRRRRNDSSALCPAAGSPPDLSSGLSLLLVLLLYSLVQVRVRTKRKRKRWRKMRMRRTCGAGEHPSDAQAPLLSLFLVVKPSVWLSRAAFLSPSLWTVSDWFSSSVVEKQTAGI